MTRDDTETILFAAIGLVQGTVLLLLLEAAADPFDGFVAVPLVATLVAAPAAYASWSPRARVAPALAVALALAVGAAFHVLAAREAVLLHFVAVATAIALPLAVAGRVVDATGGVRDREAWVDGFWFALLTLLAATLFTVFCWILIGVSFGLLDLVGLDIWDGLGRLSDYWWIPVTTLLVGVGSALLRRWPRLAEGMRGLLTAALTWPMAVFLPLLTAVAVLLLIGGPEVVDGRAGFALGLGTVAVLVLIPALFAAGTADRSRPAPPWLCRGTATVLPLLTVALLIVQARAWMGGPPEPDDFLGIALLAMALPVGVIGLTGIRGPGWADRTLDAFRIGLPVAALVGATLLPVHARIDTLTATVWAERLRAQAWPVPAADLDRLAYRYGDAGEAALRDLAADPPPGWPEAAVDDLERLADAVETRDRARPPLRLDPRERAVGLPVSPAGTPVPEAVLDALAVDGRVTRCGPEIPCGLIAPSGTAAAGDTDALGAAWTFVLVDRGLPFWARRGADATEEGERWLVLLIFAPTADGPVAEDADRGAPSWRPVAEIERSLSEAEARRLADRLEAGTASVDGAALPTVR